MKNYWFFIMHIKVGKFKYNAFEVSPDTCTVELYPVYTIYTLFLSLAKLEKPFRENHSDRS